MKTFNILPIFLFLMLSCTAQNKQQKKEQIDNSTNIPKEKVQVNKEYDELGNLIKFDSIYSYSYSSNGQLNDSIILKMQEQFSKNKLFGQQFFNNFFEEDSTFFNDHFFSKGFINHDAQFNQMMKRMDSIQQLYFNQRRGLIPPEPESKTKKNRSTKI